MQNKDFQIFATQYYRASSMLITISPLPKILKINNQQNIRTRQGDIHPPDTGTNKKVAPYRTDFTHSKTSFLESYTRYSSTHLITKKERKKVAITPYPSQLTSQSITANVLSNPIQQCQKKYHPPNQKQSNTTTQHG